MKKSYFLMALMLAVASTCLAQSKAPRTSAADGFYYGRPAGTLYRAWNEAGSGYGPIYVYGPAFQKMEITPTVNTVSSDTVRWEYRYIYSADSSKVIDVTDNYNAETGKFIVEAITPNHYVAAPTMVQDTAEFVLGEASSYLAKKVTYYTRISPMDEVAPLSFFDDHTSAKNIVGWGSVGKGYLYGSGAYKDTCTAVAVRQTYEAPIAPLYVENVWMKYVSFSETPLPEDAELTMRIYNTDTKETYATLTASAADVVQTKASTSADRGAYYTGYLSFYQKIETMFGDLANEPFVIDGPITVQISGLDQEGVEIGFYGSLNPDEDALDAAKQLYARPNGDLYSFTYKTPYAIAVMFNGMFDAVMVEDEDGANVLQVADDGTVADSAFVYTACPWYGYDEEGNVIQGTVEDDSFYSFLDYEEEGISFPEWVKDVEIICDSWDENYYSAIKFTCEPLPAGVEGRTAEIYIEGRGARNATPIILTQGKVEADAIKNINSERTASVGFNLMGVSVNDSYKGLVIKNGKKTFVK